MKKRVPLKNTEDDTEVVPPVGKNERFLPAFLFQSLLLWVCTATAMGGQVHKEAAQFRPAAYHPLCAGKALEQPRVQGRSFPLYDFPFLDGQWEGILCDSDGTVWFSVSSHSGEHHAQLFRYTPGRDRVEHVADVGQVCGETLPGFAPQGKIHSQMFQDGDWIYCGTAGAHSPGQTNYPGGYWLKIKRSTGQLINMGKSIGNDCLITVGYDRRHSLLYSITNMKGLLLSFDPKTGEEKILGVPWKDSPALWKRDLSLMVDPDGNVYGCRPPRCTFWHYNPKTDTIRDLDMAVPLPADVAAGRTNAINRYNKESGRLAMTLWNDQEKCFYVIRAHDEMLMKFHPPTGPDKPRIETLRLIGLADHRYGERHPACMFTLAGRTLWYTPYTGWGGITHLHSYDLDSRKFTEYGPIIVEGGRYVNECHSLVAGPDGRLYLVAFVFNIAGADPDNPHALRDKYPFHPRFVIIDPKTACKAGK